MRTRRPAVIWGSRARTNACPSSRCRSPTASTRRSPRSPNIAKLRSWGVTVLFGPEVYPLHDPGTGSSYLDLFPWAQAVEAINVRALEAGIASPDTAR